jgi:hypothetical protein
MWPRSRVSWRLCPLIQAEIIKQMHHVEKLSPVHVKVLVDLAKKENVKIDEDDIKKAGAKFVLVSQHDPAAWDAAISLLNYKSHLNAVAPEIPSTAGETITTNYTVVVPTGKEPPQFRVVGQCRGIRQRSLPFWDKTLMIKSLLGMRISQAKVGTSLSMDTK